jgi:endoglucanase
VAQLTVSAPAAHSSWSVSWADPGARSVTNAWGLSCRVASGRVSCTGADYARTLTAGATYNVGLQVAGVANGPAHPALTVTG